MRRPSGSASTERTLPVRIVAWIGSGAGGGTRLVANCDDVKPMAPAASAMMAARGSRECRSSKAPQIARIATAAPSHVGGSLRRAK